MSLQDAADLAANMSLNWTSESTALCERSVLRYVFLRLLPPHTKSREIICCKKPLDLQTALNNLRLASFLNRPPKKPDSMPEPDPENILSFTTPNELANWLKQNHASKTELWVKIFKKNTAIASVSWDDVVIEALCWGWIDSIKKSIDEQAYLQRITPRKARSSWSKRNRQHVEALIKAGRMMPPGLIHVEAAMADGRWENAYAVSEMEVPEDFIKTLESYPNAKAFFATLPKSSRYVIALGLTSAKRPETRQRRFEKFIDSLTRKEKPN